MKHILFDLFLVSLGAGIGVVTMCLIHSQFDRVNDGKEVRNNEFRTELIQLVFINAQSLVLGDPLLSGCISVSSVSFQTYWLSGDCLNRCRSGIQCRWRKKTYCYSYSIRLSGRNQLYFLCKML